MAAASRHPAIRAVSPQAPVYDWYMGDDFHHNGALALQPAVQFAPTVSTPRDEPTPSFRPRRLAIPDEGTFEYYLSHTVAGFTDMLGSDFEFWRQIVEHPDYDDWWLERCAERACRGIEAAVLVVGGTYDAEDCYGAWRTYDAICRLSPEADCRLVMGAWSHGAWAVAQEGRCRRRHSLRQRHRRYVSRGGSKCPSSTSTSKTRAASTLCRARCSSSRARTAGARSTAGASPGVA